MPEISRRRHSVEFLPNRHVVRFCWLAKSKLPVPVFAFLRRLKVLECGVLLIRHIAQVADEIHYLMVPQQLVHAPARNERLTLEAHHEIHHAP